MAVKKISIQEFMALAESMPVLDVRSPGEFTHAHIPGAYSLPLFTDEERKIVGTAYKQQSRETAIKAGLDFFGGKLRHMVEEVEKICAAQPSEGNKQVLLHCWRGGMRSAGVSWLLDLYGFKVHTLAGGYKAYRNWVLQQFMKPYNLQLVGGYSGSGKTELLQELKVLGQQTIDLEQLANHKGSAFGSMGEQPGQEMFENKLADALHACAGNSATWVEDESQRIGQLQIPGPFWQTMRSSPVYFVEIGFEQRLQYIVSDYSKANKEKLVNSIIRIQKRLGPLETKTAINLLLENNYEGCFDILLKYYDKNYKKSLAQRNNLEDQLCRVTCDAVDKTVNTKKLLSCAMANT